MKKIVLIAALLVSGVFFAQGEPQLEAVGQLVKATYFYDNGTIQQEGFFKDGKLDGKWTSYSENGAIQSIALFDSGIKTGKWIIDAKEVVYNNNEVLSVGSLKNALAKN